MSRKMVGIAHPTSLERVQKIVWSETAPKRMTSIPVYDLTEVS